MPMPTRATRLFLSLFLPVLAVVLMLYWLSLVNSAQAARLSAMSTLDRDLEPVIVTGVFAGAPVNQLLVYREISGNWEQIPFQVDEVTASGSYTGTEDGLADANDQVVFMARDLGSEATSSITATLPISGTWYGIKVTDPLSPTKTGWAYVVRSSVLAPTSSVDYANYVAASQRISATNYAVGWAVSHAGLDYMTLFGGGNILDRTKLRVTYGLIFTLTENDLQPVPPLILIKDGSVRVIVSQGGATTFAYASFLQTATTIDFTSLPPGTLNEIRLSTDFTSTITNGTYFDENTPNGVTINGMTDAVPGTPFVSAWRQISLTSGTTIQAVDLGLVGGTVSHYYKDDSAFDSNDTGDGRSYGDSGITLMNPTSQLFTIRSAQYILPSPQINRGAEFYQIFQNPLLVTIRARGAYSVYLPLVLKK